jgi:hypothetical protein
VDFHRGLKVCGLARATCIELVLPVRLGLDRIITLKLRFLKAFINLKPHLNSWDRLSFACAAGLEPLKVGDEFQVQNLVEEMQRRRHKRAHFKSIVFSVMLLLVPSVTLT